MTTIPGTQRRVGGHMFKRLRALLIAATVIGALVVATRVEANHGTRTLQVHPELVSTGALPGTGQALTAELSSAADGTSGAIEIDFEIEGGPADSDGISPESPDLTCTVAQTSSTCTTDEIPGTGTGQSTVRAWIDHDKKNETGQGGVTEADRAEGRLSDADSAFPPPTLPGGHTGNDCESEDGDKATCETGVVTPGTAAEPDQTDVVLIRYTSGPTKLDCVSSTGGDNETNNVADPEAYTCTVLDQFNSPLSGVRVDAENLDGANDPDNSAAVGTTDYNPGPGTGGESYCTTGSNGKCSGSIPPHEAQTGPATICFWVDQPGTTDNQTFNPGGGVSDGGDCDSETPSETPENNDVTDKVIITWNTSTPASTTTTTTAPTTTTTVAPTTTTTQASTTTTTTQASTTTTTQGTTTTTQASTTTTTTVPAPPTTPFNQFEAYTAFTGGVDIAVGNLDEDPQDEIVTGAGPGGGPHVRVFDINANGSVSPSPVSFMAYSDAFRGGVFVTIGDVNGDGSNDIITGAGPGGGPHVRVFNSNGSLQHNGWFAYGSGFTGGVDVAAGDVDGDPVAEVITGAGPGGGPHVRVFNGNGSLQNNGWFAYGAGFSGGVHVDAGDLDNDNSAAEIVTGAGPGGGPHVRVFNPSGSVRHNGWFAYGSSFTGGVSVAIGNVLGAAASADEIVTGPGPGGGPHVRVFDANGGVANPDPGFFAFVSNFSGGVVVGAGDVRTQAGETSGGEIVAGTMTKAAVVSGHRLNR